MKQKLRVLRMGLILVAVLGAAIAIGGSRRTTLVGAIDCDTAFQNYINADNTYMIARVAYFNDGTTTCSNACSPPWPLGSPGYQQCYEDCRTTQYTALANASYPLMSLAQDTCAPYQLDQCAMARALADGCLSQYDWTQYSDPDEASAVATQYAACREASKVDYCQ